MPRRHLTSPLRRKQHLRTCLLSSQTVSTLRLLLQMSARTSHSSSVFPARDASLTSATKTATAFRGGASSTWAKVSVRKIVPRNALRAGPANRWEQATPTWSTSVCQTTQIFANLAATRRVVRPSVEMLTSASTTARRVPSAGEPVRLMMIVLGDSLAG